MKLSEGQKQAIRLAARAPIMVLTGGPGCGNTAATATIVKLWRAMRMRADGQASHGSDVLLCAPTGAAALSSTWRLCQSLIKPLLFRALLPC